VNPIGEALVKFAMLAGRELHTHCAPEGSIFTKRALDSGNRQFQNPEYCFGRAVNNPYFD
jgi:hypothetical protein